MTGLLGFRASSRLCGGPYLVDPEDLGSRLITS